MYKKLKRTWSHNDLNYIPKFRETFPELKLVSSEVLCDRFIDLNLDFYSAEEVPVKFWVRLTLPFALVLMSLMFILLPVNFIFTGRWGYTLERFALPVLNWFEMLRLT